MNVAVGSKNPVKIAAAQGAFEAVWPDREWAVEGFEVASGVPDQPMSDAESIQGAETRAKRVLELSGADFGVGMEGGMQLIRGQWFTCGWIVVVDKNGHQGTGSTLKIVVPEDIMRLVREGKELGTAGDIVFGGVNTKQAQGYMGLMTNNVVMRTEGYQQAVVAALAVFLHLARTGKTAQ